MWEYICTVFIYCNNFFKWISPKLLLMWNLTLNLTLYVESYHQGPFIILNWFLCFSPTSKQTISVPFASGIQVMGWGFNLLPQLWISESNNTHSYPSLSYGLRRPWRMKMNKKKFMCQPAMWGGRSNVTTILTVLDCSLGRSPHWCWCLPHI